MAMTPAQLEHQLRGLPADERARLAAMLLESLRGDTDASIEAAWAKEIEARVIELDAGNATTYAAEDVFREARDLRR